MANVTTAAQLFHIMRRQVYQSSRRPLVLFTPKRYLRGREAYSRVAELTDGSFHEVIDDTVPADEVRRVVLATGKVALDILVARESKGVNDVAVVRVEQLYPWPAEQIEAALSRYAPRQRSRVGTRGAGQHGRVGFRAWAPGGARAGRAGLQGCLPASVGLPGHREPYPSRARTGGHPGKSAWVLGPAATHVGTRSRPALVVGPGSPHSGHPRTKGLEVADWSQWVHVTESPTCAAKVTVGTVSRGGRLAGRRASA